MGKDRETPGMDFGIRVAAVIPRDGSLLLVRHQKPDLAPYWVLPGGRLEPGESIPECAVREIAEETGLRAHFDGILYVSEFSREGRHTVDVTVRVTASGEAELGTDPEVAPGTEPTLKELQWVEAEELREIELLPAWVRERLISDAASDWCTNDIYLESSDA